MLILQDSSKKIKRIVLACSLAIGSMAFHPNSNVISSINISEEQKRKLDLKNEAEKLRQDLIQTRKNISSETKNKNELDEKISKAEKEIDELNEYINRLDSQIHETENNIIAIEKDIEEKTELLKETLVSIYKAGDVSALDIVLGAKSFEDFLDKADIVKSVSDRVKELIDALNEKSSELTAQKENLENMKQKQESERANVESKRKELQELFEESEKRLKEYGESESQTQKQIDETDAQIKRIDSAIERYYEEQRRKEEELKKQRSAQSNTITQTVQRASQVVNEGEFVWPVPGFRIISSGYTDCVNRRSAHGAIDIAGSGIYGANIVASGAGVVRMANSCVDAYGQGGGGYGKFVWIDHGNGKSTLYGHMSAVNVSIGQRVSRGQVIGHVGNTGHSTGPHLHFEFRLDGKRVNPLNYVHN